jgi:hypothetical protein
MTVRPYCVNAFVVGGFREANIMCLNFYVVWLM